MHPVLRFSDHHHHRRADRGGHLVFCLAGEPLFHRLAHPGVLLGLVCRMAGVHHRSGADPGLLSTWKSWTGKKKTRHILLGFALAAFSWITMAIIVLILDVMMDPGNWLTAPSLWSGFTNPAYGRLFARLYRGRGQRRADPFHPAVRRCALGVRHHAADDPVYA